MEQIYILSWISSLIVTSLLTIFILRYDDILKWVKSKLPKRKPKVDNREVVFEVIKEFQPLIRRYIRSVVREYLKELSGEKTRSKKGTS